jgi:hypothetical protein
MSLPVGMRCPRNTSAMKLFGPPSFVLRSSSRNALFQTAHGLGKIMIAGRLALIVAAVFAGRGSLRQHRVSRLRSFRDCHGNLAPAAIPASRHRTVAVPWTHVEWIDVAASHLALGAIDVRGNFRPLALVPLDAFAPQPPYSDGFRDPPLFRLAW